MGFWTGLINDAEKKVNPAHVITLVLTLAVVVWGSHVVYHTHAMPDLTGAGYLLGGAAGVNVAHKIEDVAGKLKGSPEPEPKD